MVSDDLHVRLPFQCSLCWLRIIRSSAPRRYHQMHWRQALLERRWRPWPETVL